MLIVSDAAWADILIEESTNREVEDTWKRCIDYRQNQVFKGHRI